MTSRARTLVGLLAIAAASALGATSASGYTALTGNDGHDQVLLQQVLGQETRSLFASARTPDGHFGPLRAISPPYHFLDQIAGLDDAGGAVALWTRERGGNTEEGDVLVAERPPGGRFGRPRNLTPGSRASASDLSVNGRGDAVAVWSRASGATQFSLRPAGGRFGPPRSVPGAHGYVTIVLDGDGGLLAVWEDEDPVPEASVLVSAYRPPGGRFGPAQDIEGGPEADQLDYSMIAVNRAGDTLLAWKEDRAIKVAERLTGGRDFGAPVTAATGLRDRDEIADLDMGAGRHALVGFGPRYGTSPGKVSVRTGGAWSAPETIPKMNEFESSAMAIDAGGDVAAVWAESDRSVKAMYRPAGAASFGPPLELAGPRPFAPGGDYVRPGVAIDAGGLATATWEQSDGAFVSVAARDFDAGGPKPRVPVGRVRSFRREGPPAACRPKWARVVRRSHRATVVEVKRGFARGLHFGCLLDRGAIVELVDSDGFYPSFRMAGPLVGYATDVCDGDYCDTLVEVTDLRDEESGLNREAVAGPGANALVSALRMKVNGAIAWVSCSSPSPGYGEVYGCTGDSRKKKRVFAWDRRSEEPRLVGRSRRIEPSSLALHGSRLSWRDGRRVRSTRLR
jgi:hypothetical protein